MKNLMRSLFVRYRVLLDGILSNEEAELIDTLKLFIEASKFWNLFVFLCLQKLWPVLMIHKNVSIVLYFVTVSCK